MSNNIKTITPASFPQGTGSSNSGVNLLQHPPGFTETSKKSNMASVAVAMVGGFPGEFPKNTKIENNWLNSPKFKTK